MPRHCLTLDLKDDKTAISEYKRYHVKIWPEVKQSLFDAGVVQMEIYLLGTRMFMIMEVSDDFSLDRKAAMDAGLDLKDLALLYISGAQVDWAEFDRNYRRYPLVLPTYPFQRQRYWVD